MGKLSFATTYLSALGQSDTGQPSQKEGNYTSRQPEERNSTRILQFQMYDHQVKTDSLTDFITRKYCKYR